MIDMNQDNFNKLVDEIMSKGYDETTAAHFAKLIGDTPTVDNEGNVVITENNTVMAKIKLDFFEQN